MTFTEAQIAALAAPLDPKHIIKPDSKFGPKADYLHGWHVINEANRIFGFDGWSSRIELTQDSLRESKDSRGDPQWQAAYTCVCSLTVGDVFRQDVGFGSGFAKQIGDAIEGATKEAATDALKRAFRTFGNQFGLALYDKTRANVGAPEPEAPPLSATNFVAGLKASDDRRSYWTANISNVPDEWHGFCQSEYLKMKKPTAAEMEKAA